KPGGRLPSVPEPLRRARRRPASIEGQGTDMANGSLTVGTDGACLGNPGPAGWAWVDEHGSFHSSGQTAGTNNIAELRAVLDALRDHRDVEHLVIQIDSTYARDCSTTWRAAWQRNGMRNSKKEP